MNTTTNNNMHLTPTSSLDTHGSAIMRTETNIAPCEESLMRRPRRAHGRTSTGASFFTGATMGMKTCTKCGETKDQSEFAKSYNCCRSCRSAYNKEHYQKNRARMLARSRKYYYEHQEEAAAYMKEHGRTEQGKLNKIVNRERYRLRYPERARASQKVCRAVQAGVLTKPTRCTECPSTKQIEAHHDDYSQPLAVRWLCHTCHQRLHSEKGE